MVHTSRLEFGNYTLKFGESKALIDLFDEVVFPSFEEGKYVRSLSGKSDYFFLDTRLIVLDDSKAAPVLGISGKIVKNTTLKREQIYRPTTGLVSSVSELETAPSSIFLLILNNHRLILSKEVKGAPTIGNFQSTSQFCLKRRHQEFIDELYQRAKSAKAVNPELPFVSKKSLLKEYPAPRLRITPLSDKQSLKAFIGRLDHIDRVTIKLLATNKEEIDNDDFWADLGRRREELNSKSAKVDFSNVREGLNGHEVYEQASAASGAGNSEIRIRGHDSEGDTISGTNEDFSLTVELEDLPKSALRAAKLMYSHFAALTASKVISLPKASMDTLRKVRKIFNGL